MKRKIKSSIHIKKANVYFILHSVRANASYSVVFTDEENEYLYDKETSLKFFRDELKKRELEYNKRTGKKLPKNTAILLSAIVNLQQHHTLEDVKKIADYLEKSLDTKVVSVAIHRDEGKLVNKKTKEEFYSGVDFIKNEFDNKLYWVDENKKLKEEVNLEEFEIVKNYHCHIEFLGLDSNGVAIKRNKLNKYYLSKLQTFVANTLGMERGYNYYLNNKKAPKRLDVKEFKVAGVLKREGAKLARVKDLKELNKQMREFYKEKGAERADYAELEEFVKQVKEKIKNKELTITELVKLFDMQLKKFIKKIKSLEQEKKELKKLVYSDKYKKRLDNNEIRQATYAEVAEHFKTKYEELEKEYNELIDDYNELVDKVDDLEEENKRLREEIELLKQQLMQNYRAEIYCVTCNRVKPFDPYIIMRLKAKNLIEEYKRNDEGKMIIKTKEFELEEIKEEGIKKKEGFKIKKEKGQLTEEEIEKAILIILQIKGWDINDIKANGSEDFVEKANRVIEKLKVERIVEENFENLRWSLSEQFYRYCEKNNPEYNDFEKFFKEWIVEQVLKGNINLNDYIKAKSANLGFKFKR